MDETQHSLPAMKALMAFEATVRLGSMTAAARELATTQPAISQRIRTLEESVGHPLFNRQPGKLLLTDEGEFFFNNVSTALSKIQHAVVVLREKTHNEVPKITIAAGFGLAHFWLLPRIEMLEQAFPGLSFHVTAVDKDFLPEMQTADIAIRFGHFDDQQLNQVRLAMEKVFPVCSPQLKERYNLKETLTEEDLKVVPLLHMDHKDPRWLDWQLWCKLSNLPELDGPIRFSYNNYPLLLSATEQGQGVALGWSSVVGQLIDQGKLVSLQPAVTRENYGYILSSKHPNNALLQPVIFWLKEEFARQK